MLGVLVGSLFGSKLLSLDNLEKIIDFNQIEKLEIENHHLEAEYDQHLNENIKLKNDNESLNKLIK